MILALFLFSLLQAPAAPAPAPVQASGWEELAREYEKASEAWGAEMFRTGAFEKPEIEHPPSPALGFWPRFEALAQQGDGRAIVWLLQNLNFEPEKRAARATALLELVRKGADAPWVATAIHALVDERVSLPGLDAYLSDVLRNAKTPAVRVAALLGRAACATDAARADDLRTRAAFLHWKEVELGDDEKVEGALAAELGAAMVDGVEKEGQANFARSFYEGTDGVYYAHAEFEPDPKDLWRTTLEAVARRGSADARLWVLTNTWPRSEEEKAALREHLDALAKSGLDAEGMKKILWRVSTWMRTLGGDFVEPRVRQLAAQAGDDVQAQLLYGLGQGMCETAEGDIGRGRGLALLKEVQERWPKSEPAKRAAGQEFRFSNLLVGKQIPDFEAVDVDGNAFKLSDYKGKVTVVDFWGFW